MSPKNTNSTPKPTRFGSLESQTVVFITSGALASVLEGAKRTHPNEFVAVMRGARLSKPQVVELWGEGVGKASAPVEGKSLEGVRAFRLDDVLVPPFAFNERDSSGFSDWFMPTDASQIGTFHSHPSVGLARPSRQDLLFFERHGPVHLIATAPYGENDVRAFDARGKNVPLYGIR